jgi:hypothetical protein
MILCPSTLLLKPAAASAIENHSGGLKQSKPPDFRDERHSLQEMPEPP